MDRLGPYTNLEKIGEGGMGVTYRAWQPSLNRHVAIKMLREGADETAIERFRREGTAIAKMEKNPNVVEVYDAHVDEPPYYLVLEYLQGRSLASLIREKDRLPQEEAVHLVIQVLQGLGHAHGYDVFHRDIKPDNIIVNDAGKPTITDFGIAQISGQPGVTATGMSIGTLEYMSPEQLRGLKVDHRTDLYSAGVVLYEVLTGRTPFVGGGPVTVMNRIANDAPPAPHGFYDDIPEALGMVVLKALEKDPRDRFQSGAEMAQALEATLREPETTAKRKEGEPPPPPPPPSPPPRRRVPPLAVALVVVLLLIGGLLYAIVGKRTDVGPPPPPPVPVPTAVSPSQNKDKKVPGPIAPPPPVGMTGMVGWSVAAAQKEADKLGVRWPSRTASRYDTTPKGCVLSHIPGAGKPFTPGQVLEVVLSLGPRPGPPPARKYNCDYPGCRAQFSTSKELATHKKTHRPTPPPPPPPTYACDYPGCNAEFTSSEQLTVHKATHRPQPPQQTFTCKVCGEKFTDKGQRDFHQVLCAISAAKKLGDSLK